MREAINNHNDKHTKNEDDEHNDIKTGDNVNADNNTWIGVNDTDITTVLGRVALHSVSSDYATFSHYDQRSSGVGYALRQSSAGSTMVNAPSGRSVNLAINNSQKLTVDQNGNVGIGDTTPSYKLDVNGTGRFTSDLTVGGNVLINGITDAGGVPKFLVRRTSDTSAISQNAWTTIVFNGEDFDTGSDFNVTNGIFSAPVAGYYHFSWQLRFNNVPSTTDYIWTRLLTTDDTILAGIVRIDAFADATINYWQTGGSATVHLDAGDTVRVDAYNANGGTGITIDGSSSNYQSWFTGHMVI